MTEPRNHTPRSELPTLGGRVARVAEAKGRPLMPWQRLAADVSHEFDPDTGLLRFGIVVVSVPRQAGKTAMEGDVADARCLWTPNQFVRITMQDGKTADEWMREQHFPALEGTIFDGRFKESKRAGSHGVFWRHNRSSFTTFPPTRKALHSKQTDLAFVDEAWAHDAEAGRELRQAIRPTMNTRRNAQLWIVSTRGDGRSAYLREYIARGLASLDNPASRVCFIDYGIGPEDDPNDLDAVASRHPAYGRTINRQALEDAREEFILKETGLLDVKEWARAYGNAEDPGMTSLIPAGVWTETARARPAIPPRVGLGLDASPDGSRFALAAAWTDAAEHSWVEIIEAGPIERQTPARIAAVCRARGVPLTVDRGALAALEITDAFAQLEPGSAPDVSYLSTAQYASACAVIYRGIFAETTHHSNDPDLDRAVESAARRDIGDGLWGWGRKPSAGPICELVAATVALKGFDLLPAPLRKPVAVAGAGRR